MEENDKRRINRQRIKNVVNFSVAGCQYVFDNPVLVNLMKLENPGGWIAVSREYDKYFIGMGHTAPLAFSDWSSKFHYNYQRMEVFDDINPDLKLLMENNIDRQVYLNYEPLIVKKQGEVVVTRLPGGSPSVIRWRGGKGTVPVPPDVYRDFLFFRKGDRFCAVAEYDRKTYKLSKILYAEKEERNDPGKHASNKQVGRPAKFKSGVHNAGARRHAADKAVHSGRPDSDKR